MRFLQRLRYDANDRQVSKVVGTSDTQYYYDGAQRVADYSGGALQDRYVNGGDGEVAIRVSSGGAKTYYHTDREGSVVALSNSSGAVTNKYAYSPFGESDSLSGTTHGYLGQRFDKETGLSVSTDGSAFDASRGRAVIDTTGGSIGFGNTSGFNSQQQPGPTPVSNPGQFNGIGGVSPSGPDPRNPFFAYTPQVPPSVPDPIYIPTLIIVDPTKGKGGSAGTDRKQLLKELMELFRDMTIGEAEELLEYLSKPHSHAENLQCIFASFLAGKSHQFGRRIA